MQKKHTVNASSLSSSTPKSRKLREIMETPPRFWLRGGIALTCALFAILFLILCVTPMERYGGVSIITYLLRP